MARDRSLSAAHQLPEHLPPEGLVRRVLDRNVGVHLPAPGVLDGKGEGAAATVTLEREDDSRLTGTVSGWFAREKRGGARLHPGHGVDGRQGRQGSEARFAVRLRGRELSDGLGRAEGRDADLEPLEPIRRFSRGSVRRGRRGVGRVQSHRQGLGHRRAGISALRERLVAPQHQEPAAALRNEFREHPHLVDAEEARLHASDYEAAVGEQFLARAGEPRRQFLGIVHVKAQKLVIGRPFQGDHLEVLVVLHRSAEELRLEPRGPLEIQDLLPPAEDVEGDIELVVLGHLLARDRRDLEPKQARARLVGADGHPNRGGLGGDHRNILGGEDPARVLHREMQGTPSRTLRLEGDAGHDRAALERRRRNFDAGDFDVLREGLSPKTDGEHRDLPSSEVEQRLAQRSGDIVRAIADQDQARDRDVREFLLRASAAPRRGPCALRRTRDSRPEPAPRSRRNGRSAV